MVETYNLIYCSIFVVSSKSYTRGIGAIVVPWQIIRVYETFVITLFQRLTKRFKESIAIATHRDTPILNLLDRRVAIP